MVSRLYAPIEGTDAARLADCLGLDPAKYHAAAASAGSGLRDALEDALIASTAMLDSDARYKVTCSLASPAAQSAGAHECFKAHKCSRNVHVLDSTLRSLYLGIPASDILCWTLAQHARVPLQP